MDFKGFLPFSHELFMKTRNDLYLSRADPKGRETLFQDFAYVIVLKGVVGPSEELLVQKEKKYSLGTLSSGRRLHTLPYS